MTTTPLLASKGALKEHFHGAVRLAVSNQGLAVTPLSCDYLASLLLEFARASALLLAEPEVRFLHRPLLELWADAQASRGTQRLARLRALGDLTLFVSGYFTDALERRLVDVDYYIAMGGHAYQRIAADLEATGSQALFEELALNFARFVDVLSEVSAQDAGRPSQGLLRLYERWLRTGSAWAARQLGERGVLPIDPGGPGTGARTLPPSLGGELQ